MDTEPQQATICYLCGESLPTPWGSYAQDRDPQTAVVTSRRVCPTCRASFCRRDFLGEWHIERAQRDRGT